MRIAVAAVACVILAVAGTSAQAAIAGDNVAAISTGPGSTNIFVTSAGGEVFGRNQSGTWGNWYSLGGTATSAPAAVLHNSIIHVFVRGIDNALYHRYRSASGWSSWQSFGGTLTSAPSAATRQGTGEVDVAARGTDGAVWHKFWTPSTGWSGWESLGGAIQGSPTLVSHAYGNLDVIVRGTDNIVYQRFWDRTYWTSWNNLGGSTVAAPSASSQGANSLDVYVRGTDGLIYQRMYRDLWSGWFSIGSAPGASLASVVRAPLNVSVFAKSNGTLYANDYVGAWSGWHPWMRVPQSSLDLVSNDMTFDGDNSDGSASASARPNIPSDAYVHEWTFTCSGDYLLSDGDGGPVDQPDSEGIDEPDSGGSNPPAWLLRRGYHDATTNKGFGYRHIRDRHGWNQHVFDEIHSTLCDGGAHNQGGGTWIYTRYDVFANEFWTVVEQRRRAKDGHSKGIITAYPQTLTFI